MLPNARTRRFAVPAVVPITLLRRKVRFESRDRIDTIQQLSTPLYLILYHQRPMGVTDDPSTGRPCAIAAAATPTLIQL